MFQFEDDYWHNKMSSVSIRASENEKIEQVSFKKGKKIKPQEKKIFFWDINKF